MKKRESKADFLRGWGLPYPSFQYSHLRYKNPPEKGVYWYYISRFVRDRDEQNWGTCISCDRPITVDTSDAGHFMPAGDCGRGLLFDLRNINAECSYCNAFDSTHLFGYAEGLDRRYGKGTAIKLRSERDNYKSRAVPLKDWSKTEYQGKIKDLLGVMGITVDKLDSNI